MTEKLSADGTPIRRLVGTSSGALNATMIAAGVRAGDPVDAAKKLTHLWEEKADVWRIVEPDLASWFHWRGVSGTERIIDLLEAECPGPASPPAAPTRPCQVGQPCPAGWCSLPQPLDGGRASGGGVSTSAACACPGSGGDACVTQIGGPAIQAQPPITCEAIPESCMLPDRCACLAQGTLERCWPSDQVTNLCVCDNGIR